MSSYYTTAQLEEMRRAQIEREIAAEKARLKKAMEDSIQRISDQLRKQHVNEVKATETPGEKMTVFISDQAVSGYRESAVITGATLQNERHVAKVKRDELDFSGLLQSEGKKATALASELNAWLGRIDERPVISEKDEKDRKRLIAELEKTVAAASVDIEDKIRSVKMRVSSYLQGSARMTPDDEASIQSDYCEYCVLCDMLEMKPTEKFPWRIKKEIERMNAVLSKRTQDEYIMSALETIMDEMGLHAKDNAVLDHTAGQLYAVDGHPFCDVFVGNDGSGIMFEPIGESREGSVDKRRQIEHSANSICRMYAVLEEKAAEKGVILNRVYAAPARIDQMSVQTDVSERSAAKRQKKSSVLKQRALDSEG